VTDTTTHPSRRAGLRDEIARALEAADYRMDMRRGDLADAIMPVLYREWPWLRAEAEDASAAVVPAADRAALRDRTAALADDLRYVLDYRGPRHSHEQPGVWDTSGKPCTHCARLAVARENLAAYDADADVVLPAPADRAAVLRETADRLVEEIQRGFLSHRDVRLAGLCESVGLLRQWAAEAAVPAVGVAADTTPGETCVELQVWPLQRILTEVRCGSKDWPWEEEWADLARRHSETGYLDRLAEKISENGITMPVLIGSDGRLWDGHHRLCIAVRLGIGYVPVEIVPPRSDPPGPVVPAQPGNDTKTPVGYRSRDGRALYCTRHTGEIFGFDWRPVDSDDLPDGGICTYPDCGADVLIPQQPKEARPPVGYSGKGRLWCLTCPRPDREDVPMTIGLVCVGELCAGCGRDVIEAARSTEQQPAVIRCVDAAWTDRPHPPHNWQQRPDAAPVRCPGVGGEASS
jgi:hypothetical protein